MQENTILIFHNSGLDAKCFSVKLKLLANRLLHPQFYILQHLKEEGSGANTIFVMPLLERQKKITTKYFLPGDLKLKSLLVGVSKLLINWCVD